MSVAGYDSAITEADLPAMSRLIAHAFATPPELTSVWLKNAGLGESRVMRDSAGTPEACLLRVPQGHFYGGRSVPALGIAGVAVAPEARGRGLAREMMRASMLEAAEEGWALSSLYASTQSLYRQVGFEQAGVRCALKLRAADFRLGDDGGGDWKKVDVRALADADEESVRGCYRAFAERFDGLLDRGPYCWKRVSNLRNELFNGFGFFGAHGALEGYVYLNQRRNAATGHHDIQTTDVVFTTARAGRAIIRFFGGFATTADEVFISAAPNHPLLALLEQQCFKLELQNIWMLRVVDVRAALEGRGWASGLHAEAALEVTDALLPRNNGVWRLRIADGRGSVGHAPGARTGEDALRMTERGFAALYSGMFSARQAVMTGLAEGSEAAIAAAERAFPGGSPWMLEIF